MNARNALILSLILLAGCKDERAGIVVDYLTAHSKNETQYKVNHLWDRGFMTAGDSLDILVPLYDKNKKEFFVKYQDLLAASTSLRNNQKDRQQVKESMDPTLLEAGDTAAWMSALEKRILKGNAEALTFRQKEFVALRNLEERIAHYKETPEQILVRSVRVTYSEAPKDGGDQEITKTFLFTPDNKRVVGVVD